MRIDLNAADVVRAKLIELRSRASQREPDARRDLAREHAVRVLGRRKDDEISEKNTLRILLSVDERIEHQREAQAEKLEDQILGECALDEPPNGHQPSPDSPELERLLGGTGGSPECPPEPSPGLRREEVAAVSMGGAGCMGRAGGSVDGRRDGGSSSAPEAAG